MFFVSADGTCLLNSGVVHMTCTGFQKEVIFYFIFIENLKKCEFTVFYCTVFTIRPFCGYSAHPTRSQNCSCILPVLSKWLCFRSTVGTENYHWLLECMMKDWMSRKEKKVVLKNKNNSLVEVRESCCFLIDTSYSQGFHLWWEEKKVKMKCLFFPSKLGQVITSEPPQKL